MFNLKTNAMKRILEILVLAIMPLIMSFTCMDKEGTNCHRHITIVNNSDMAIVVSGGAGVEQPDEFARGQGIQLIVLSPRDKSPDILTRNYCFEYYFDHNYTTAVNIFDAQPINGRYILVHIVYPTLKQLQQGNWTVVYNGETDELEAPY
jgi:hypothetical protein